MVIEITYRYSKNDVIRPDGNWVQYLGWFDRRFELSTTIHCNPGLTISGTRIATTSWPEKSNEDCKLPMTNYKIVINL